MIELSEQVFGDVTVLAPTGRIDLSNGEEFSTRLLEVLGRHSSAPPLLLLDLGGLEYIASVGLRALMVAAKQAKTVDGKVAVANLTPTVAEIFDISRFRFVLPVFDSTKEALESLSEAAIEIWSKSHPA